MNIFRQHNCCSLKNLKPPDNCLLRNLYKTVQPRANTFQHHKLCRSMNPRLIWMSPRCSLYMNWLLRQSKYQRCNSNKHSRLQSTNRSPQYNPNSLNLRKMQQTCLLGIACSLPMKSPQSVHGRCLPHNLCMSMSPRRENRCPRSNSCK